MPENGSSRAYELWRDAAEKFDYFMAGLSAALLAYIAPTLEPVRIGPSAESLELAAVLAFIASTFAAFKRIESSVHLQRVGVARLEQLESATSLRNALRDGVPIRAADADRLMDPAEIQALLDNRTTLVEIARTIEKSIKMKSERWYSARYYLLLLGFLLLLISRVWAGYS